MLFVRPVREGLTITYPNSAIHIDVNAGTHVFKTEFAMPVVRLVEHGKQHVETANEIEG